MVPTWKYLKTSEVCELLGRGRTWLWRQVRDGKFPQPDRLGSSVRFRSDVVAGAMEQQSAQAAQLREQSEAAARKLSALGVEARRAYRLTASPAVHQGGAQ